MNLKGHQKKNVEGQQVMTKTGCRDYCDKEEAFSSLIFRHSEAYLAYESADSYGNDKLVILIFSLIVNYSQHHLASQGEANNKTNITTKK